MQSTAGRPRHAALSLLSHLWIFLSFDINSCSFTNDFSLAGRLMDRCRAVDKVIGRKVRSSNYCEGCQSFESDAGCHFDLVRASDSGEAVTCDMPLHGGRSRLM